MNDNIKVSLPTKKTIKQRLPPLLSWSNPIKSGGTFASVIGFLLVIKFCGFLPLLLWATYWTIGISTFTEYFTRSLYGTNKGLISSSVRPSRYIVVDETHIQNSVQTMADCGSHVIKQFKRILDVEDPFASMMVAGVSYIIYQIISLVSLWSFLILWTIAAFTVPALYLKFEEPIDAKVHKAAKICQEKINDVLTRIDQTAGPYVQDIKKRADSVVSILRPTRGGFDTTYVKGQDANAINTAPAEGERAIIKSDEIPEKKQPESTKSTDTNVVVEKQFFTVSEPIKKPNNENISVPVVSTQSTTVHTSSSVSDSCAQAINADLSKDPTNERHHVDINDLKNTVKDVTGFSSF